MVWVGCRVGLVGGLQRSNHHAASRACDVGPVMIMLDKTGAHHLVCKPHCRERLQLVCAGKGGEGHAGFCAGAGPQLPSSRASDGGSVAANAGGGKFGWFGGGARWPAQAVIAWDWPLVSRQWPGCEHTNGAWAVVT